MPFPKINLTMQPEQGVSETRPRLCIHCLGLEGREGQINRPFLQATLPASAMARRSLFAHVHYSKGLKKSKGPILQLEPYKGLGSGPQCVHLPKKPY